MKHWFKAPVCALAAMFAAVCLVSVPASAGALCAVGTSGFGCTGPGIANLSGTGFNSITNLGLSFLLNDGLLVAFDIKETVTGNLGAGATTSATIRLTNVVAANFGGAPVNDTIYIFSDIFNPSVPGT